MLVVGTSTFILLVFSFPLLGETISQHAPVLFVFFKSSSQYLVSFLASYVTASADK